MLDWKTVDQVLDYAIGEEEAAARSYTELAEKMARPWMRQVFLDFARVEKGHKAKLLAVKDGRLLLSAKEKVMDLKVGDYLVEVEPGPDLD